MERTGDGIQSSYGDGPSVDIVLIATTPTLLAAQARVNGGTLYKSESALPSGLFHVVLNFQRIGFMDVYVDGILVSSVVSNMNGTLSSARATIAANFDGNVYNALFNGTIEQRRTFNRVLTQSEITLLANET